MLPQSGVTASRSESVVRLDIRRFPWIRRLAADYAFDYARVAEFFAGNPAEPAAWRDAIGRTQRHARDRRAIADILHAQQRRRGAPPESVAAAARLRDAETVAIVTGQQAGLFGGPLFTLLKALTAIRLAERVRQEHGVAAVPIFWVDAEDHDWDEVRTAGVLDADLQLRHIALDTLPGAHEGPVARICLDESVHAAIGELEAALQPTEFTPEVLDQVRRAYAPGAGMADAFGALLEAVLGPRGLVVYDASDRAAKPLVADLFAREVERAGESARLAAAAGEVLQARGYHVQVTPQADMLALFHLEGGGRQSIRRTEDGFTVGERTESRAALAERVRRDPGAFSPNVLLRPLVQDTLFPTACYVAGPNELAYLGQLGRVYDAFDLPMPLIQPRAMATILDANAMRFLTRQEVPLEALRAQDEAALNALLESQLPASIEASLHDAGRAVDEGLTRLAVEVIALDPTLEGAARSTLGRMQEDLKKLHGKIIQASKRKNETLRRQFHHAQAQAFPGGHSQEREIAFVYFLNKYGPALVERLNDELTFDAGTHWVVTI